MGGSNNVVTYYLILKMKTLTTHTKKLHCSSPKMDMMKLYHFMKNMS
jgi:hypothetical protein